MLTLMRICCQTT